MDKVSYLFPRRGRLIIGERDTYRGNTIENRGCLLASEVASETLTGVKMKIIGDVCLFV